MAVVTVIWAAFPPCTGSSSTSNARSDLGISCRVSGPPRWGFYNWRASSRLLGSSCCWWSWISSPSHFSCIFLPPRLIIFSVWIWWVGISSVCRKSCWFWFVSRWSCIRIYRLRRPTNTSSSRDPSPWLSCCRCQCRLWIFCLCCWVLLAWGLGWCRCCGRVVVSIVVMYSFWFFSHRLGWLILGDGVLCRLVLRRDISSWFFFWGIRRGRGIPWYLYYSCRGRRIRWVRVSSIYFNLWRFVFCCRFRRTRWCSWGHWI